MNYTAGIGGRYKTCAVSATPPVLVTLFRLSENFVFRARDLDATAFIVFVLLFAVFRADFFCVVLSFVGHSRESTTASLVREPLPKRNLHPW